MNWQDIPIKIKDRIIRKAIHEANIQQRKYMEKRHEWHEVEIEKLATRGSLEYEEVEAFYLWAYYKGQKEMKAEILEKLPRNRNENSKYFTNRNLNGSSKIGFTCKEFEVYKVISKLLILINLEK